MRLSRDDEGTTESASIQTQRSMLTSYAKENGFIIHDEYVDDGWSGTNFDRPAFKRLVADIEAGYVNMVISKDLSRLGRDYITAGEYTERYFPEHGVRYIAINDGYDSSNSYNDIAPFKNVINEMYARDISKKIRSAFQTKMKDGCYIGNFAPYGYMKDPQNKNHLIVDYRVAPIVQEIFRRAEQGERPKEIAQSLNQREIMPPAVYRCSSRAYLDISNYSERKEWTSGSICKLLRNIVYLGHTAQGKTEKVSFKSHVTLRKEPDEWVVIRNTHEPLVTQATYDMVRNRSVSRKNEPKNCFENIFSGIAKCADCGRNMSTTGTRKKGAIANLVCGGYKLYGSKECSNHFIDYQALYDVVISELRKQTQMSASDISEILDDLEKEAPNELRNDDQINKVQSSLNARAREIDTIIQKLYEDNVSGKISNERFDKLLLTYETEQKEALNRISSLSESVTGRIKPRNSVQQYLELLKDLTDVTELTPELLHHLIDHIDIEQGEYIKTPTGKRKIQKIKIYYKFIGNINEFAIA
jgi:DNA invertase Pin-like site-specific DNA recombinase/DNA-binding MarR family transcriptional regulator